MEIEELCFIGSGFVSFWLSLENERYIILYKVITHKIKEKKEFTTYTAVLFMFVLWKFKILL